jgi:hypothetical protein
VKTYYLVVAIVATRLSDCSEEFPGNDVCGEKALKTDSCHNPSGQPRVISPYL